MKLTQAQLKEVLEYDRFSGVFRWVVDKSQGMKAGMVAGSKDPLKYTDIFIDGRSYKARRLAWLYIYGEMPKGRLKGINNVCSDNRIDNLVDMDNFDLNRSHRVSPNSKSGVKGVIYRKDQKRWVATITINKKRLNLGSFVNKVDAINARVNAELKHNYHDRN